MHHSFLLCYFYEKAFNVKLSLIPMEIINEFKAFIAKGNVLDLAVGFIMGAAFKDVVNSLVNDIIMPPIGLLLGGVDFSDLKIVLKEATSSSSEVAIAYGHFINVVIEFLIIGFSIFLVVKAANKFRKKEEKPKPAPKEAEDVKLLKEIRDLLKKK